MNAITSQALEIFRSVRTVPLPNRRFDRMNSREADKFVVRLPDGMRAEVEAASDDQFTSMNSFILQAIAEKLDRGGRQDLLLATLAKAVLAGQEQDPAVQLAMVQSRLEVLAKTARHAMGEAEVQNANA